LWTVEIRRGRARKSETKRVISPLRLGKTLTTKREKTKDKQSKGNSLKGEVGEFVEGKKGGNLKLKERKM